MADPRPLAVALVDVTGAELVEQVRARQQVADIARTEGYELEAVLEVGGTGRRDVDVYAAAAALARRAGTSAFVVHGRGVDQLQLRHAAGDPHARIIPTADASAQVPAPAGPGRPTGRRLGGTPHGTLTVSARWPGGRLVTPVGAR